MDNRNFSSYLISITIFLGMSCVWIQHASAQLTDTTRNIVEEGYIEKMNNNFGIKISLDNAYETFMVDTETNDVMLSPNITTLLLFGLNYRFIRFSVGFAPDFFPGNGDEDIKGKTSAFNFKASMFFRHWFQELSYTRVKGYYLQNTADYIPWSEGDPYIQFPELVYTGFAGATGYSLNPKLSLRSLTLQSDRQLKSAGSFLAVLNYRYYIIDDKQTPNPGGATQKSNNLEVNLGPGYVYTFVLKERFFASLGFTPGLGLIHTALTTRYAEGDVKSKQNNLAFRWDGKGAAGYNGRSFFSGFYISYSGMSYNQENTTAVNHDNRMFYQFYVGMRIRAPKKMNSFFDSIFP